MNSSNLYQGIPGQETFWIQHKKRLKTTLERKDLPRRHVHESHDVRIENGKPASGKTKDCGRRKQIAHEGDGFTQTCVLMFKYSEIN